MIGRLEETKERLWEAWDLAGSVYEKLGDAAKFCENEGDTEAAGRIRGIMAAYEAEAGPLEHEILLSSGIHPKRTIYECNEQFCDLLAERFPSPIADTSCLLRWDPDAGTGRNLQTLTETLQNARRLAQEIDRAELSATDAQSLDEVAEYVGVYASAVQHVTDRHAYSR